MNCYKFDSYCETVYFVGSLTIIFFVALTCSVFLCGITIGGFVFFKRFVPIDERCEVFEVEK